MQNKKFIKNLTVIIAILCLSVSALFLPKNKSSNDVKAAEYLGETIEASILNLSSTSAMITPDTSLTVNFKIVLSEAVPDDCEVTVYFRTRNESAIASVTKDGKTTKNDYDPLDGRITFKSGEKEQRRSVQTYMQNTTAIKYTGTARKDVTETRTFEISIYKVESSSCNVAISKKAPKIRACLKAERAYEVTTATDSNESNYEAGSTVQDSYGNNLSYDKQLYYKAYTSCASLFSSNVVKFGWFCDGSKNKDVEPFKDIGTTLKEFLNLGMAHPYMGITMMEIGDDTVFSACEKDNEVTLYCVDDNDNKKTVQYMWSDRTHNDGAYTYAKDISELFLKQRDGDKWLRGVTSDTSLYTDSSTYLRYSADTILFRMEDLKANVKVWSDCWIDSKWFDIYYRALIVDDILPKAVSYTYDNVSLTGGEKARISVRFNENVQVSSDAKAVAPQLHVQTVTATPRNLYFDYVGGSGTDTLWFEYDMKNYTYGDTLQYIKPIALLGDICDLSMNRAKSSNDSYVYSFGSNFVDLNKNRAEDTGVKFPFAYDFRKPKINVANDSEELKLEQVSREKIANLALNDCEYATVKYAWSKEKTDKEYFEDYTDSVIWENNTQLITGGNIHQISGPNNVTGKYYLYIEAYSPLLISQKFRFGPYSFDNTAPTVTGYQMPTDTLKEKSFKFTAEDNMTDIADVSFAYYESKAKKSTPVYTNEIPVFLGGETKLQGATRTKEDNKTYVTFTLKASDFGLNDDEFGYYFGTIRVTDTLGNVYERPQEQFRYDTRKLFYTSVNVTDGDILTITTYNERVYDVRNKGITVKSALTAESQDDVGGTWGISSIMSNGTDITSQTQYYSFNSSTQVLTINNSAPLGELEVVYSLTKGGSTKISETYVYYLVRGDEETNNKTALLGNNLLINKVYQLNIPYYYLLKTDTGVTQVKEIYGGASSSQRPTFSSKEEAYKYVKFKELQSMYLEEISENAANMLNRTGGDTNYSKAMGETKTAEKGQLWIRYKRSTWGEPTSINDLSGWCYYYYGESYLERTIDIDKFSTLLSDAIDAVSEHIAGDDVTKNEGGETVWLYGNPTLKDTQMHVNEEFYSKSYSGTPFAQVQHYSGDGKLYNNSVRADDIQNAMDVVIATDYRIHVGDYTRIFIASAYDGTVNGSYKEFVCDDGTTFGELENDLGKKFTTGIYSVREIDEHGMSEYFIYIDRTEPYVYIDLLAKTQDGNFENVTLKTNKSESDAHIYSARSATLRLIEESEKDDYAYVCLRQYHTNNIIKTFHAEDLKNLYEIPDGYYLIEVCDRSNNYYSFTLRVSDDDLSCRIVSDGTKFTFVCNNRSSDQIYQYLIKRNGEVVADSYVEKYSTTASGFYEIYVEDIFGNIFEQAYPFSRALPEVQWWYLSDNNEEYIPYDVDSTEMTITAVSEYTNLINTAREIRFSYTGSYTFEVTEGEFEKKFNSYSGTTYVTLTPTGNMKVTVAYEDSPDVYVIYLCSFDKYAPTVRVSYMANSYGTCDFDDVDYLALNDGDIIIPSTLEIFRFEAVEKTVFSGDSVKAMLFNISVEDESGMGTVEVYVNDVLFKVIEPTNNTIKDFTLSKSGNYRIVAKDVFGNICNFTFENKEFDGISYYIDGVKQKTVFGGTEYFVDGEYTKCDYGGESQEIRLTGDHDVSYIVEVDGEKYFYSFNIKDGKVSARNYYFHVYTKPTADGEETIKEIAKNDALIFEAVKGEDHSEYAVTNDAFNIKIGCDKDGVWALSVICLTDSELSIDARVYNNNEQEPLYVKTLLSTAIPSLDFIMRKGEDGEVGVPTSKDGEDLLSATAKVNDNFTIDVLKFETLKMKSVYMGFSMSSNVTEFYGIYGDNCSIDGFYQRYDIGDTKDESYKSLSLKDKLYNATLTNGYYVFKIENLYGNTFTYTVIRADGFFITSAVTYQDSTKVYYDLNFSDKIYSNCIIEYSIFYNADANEMEQDDARVSTSAFTFTLKKDGEEISGGNIKNGQTLLLEEDGDYELIIYDEYGNEKKLTAEIKKYNLALPEGTVYGFNDNALLKNEGYSNNYLSLDGDKIREENYSFISIRKVGKEAETVLDTISQNKVYLLDDAVLLNCIGKDGDGEYEIIFRDKYGNRITEYVHLRFTTTLSLYRTTRNSDEREEYSLYLATDENDGIGFWANDSLMFETEASTYEFKIDGKPYTITMPLTFKTATEENSYVYQVDYVDEYGFKYSFKAHLYRGTPKLELSEGVKVQTISGKNYTRTTLSYDFGEDSTCVYYKDDDENPTPYVSGTKLYKDGTYLFEVTDYAGNINSDIIILDTTCDYRFRESRVDKTVVFGTITNASSVVFESSNLDEVKIEKALLNGVEVLDFKDDNILENGTWEFIVQDRLGNVDYFKFVLINHAQSKVNYTLPENYQIKEAWYKGSDGVRRNYLSYVETSEDGTSFAVSEDGLYDFVMSSIYTNEVISFNIEIDNKVPEATLVGCEEGETTINTITLKGLKIGDKIEVFRDGKLERSTVYNSSADLPEITEGGDYDIVVTSISGIQKTLSFKRKHVANTAGSIMIIIFIIGAFLGLFIGLVYRTKLKTDE